MISILTSLSFFLAFSGMWGRNGYISGGDLYVYNRD